MRSGNTDEGSAWGIGALVSLLVPAAAMFVWREFWWPAAVFVLWTAAAALLYTSRLKRGLREQNKRSIDSFRRTAIRTLAHHRHDWMNDLQILYGYLTLNKPDKAVGVVDRIRERMENDSKVSQLASVRLAAYLLSFRAVCQHMRLDVRIEDGVDLELRGLDPVKVGACLIGLIDAFRYRSVSVPAAGENVLHVRMFMHGGSLSVEMVYEGELGSWDGLSEEASRLLDGMGKWTEEKDGDNAQGPNRAIAVFRPSA